MSGSRLNLPRTELYLGLITDGGTNPAAIPWERPKNATMHHIICVGAGAGGGSGWTGATSTARGGGGGGASGSIASLIVAASLLPKVLYLFPGTGGIGGVGVVGAGNGGRTAIADKSSGYLVAADTVLVSDAGQSFPGTNGTTAGSDFGGGLTGAATNLLGAYQCLGIWNAITGLSGQSAGALGAAGLSTTFGANGICVTEGVGGGSCSAANVAGAGGAITGAGRVQTLPGGLGGTTGGDGSSGNWFVFPWTAGSGGGSGSTGRGGNGGNGAPGCGGSGGGGGVTGGNGGAGGPGAIIIVSW